VDGKFPLRHELGGSDKSVVFLTERSDREPRRAAIKLTPSTGHGDEARLARWAAATRLSHPHLMRLFESGRCELDGTPYLYVVMEYAEEDLSQILPQRPLTPVEASDVLWPTAEVLAYLHQAGFVHGHIKPSNILAVDNHLKVSVDGLCRQGEQTERRRLTVYDAPEVATAGMSPEADVWSLGVTLVATLTQYPPDFTNANPPQAIVPETVPQPFREIARRCLSVDPRHRCTAAEIETSLQIPPPMVPEKAEMPAGAGKPQPRRRTILVVGAVIALLAVLGVREFLTRRPPVPPAEQPAQSSPAPATPAPATQPSPPPPFLQKQNQAKGPVRGTVLHQAVPNVPQSARNTITGKVKVNVRVSVDSSGRVSEARLVSKVESKYFARLALESARQWSFTPPQVAGQATDSEWILRYQFGRSGTQVFPTEVGP